MMRLEEKREDAVPWETEGRGVSGLMGRLVPHLSGLWSRVSMMGPKSELGELPMTLTLGQLREPLMTTHS